MRRRSRSPLPLIIRHKVISLKKKARFGGLFYGLTPSDLNLGSGSSAGVES